MMLARCPACQTVFRVRPEQLRAHKGRVRCGHCHGAFNALEHLIEETDPAPPRSATAVDTPNPAPPPDAAAVMFPPASEGAIPPPEREDRFFVLEEKASPAASPIDLDFTLPESFAGRPRARTHQALDFVEPPAPRRATPPKAPPPSAPEDSPPLAAETAADAPEAAPTEALAREFILDDRREPSDANAPAEAAPPAAPAPFIPEEAEASLAPDTAPPTADTAQTSSPQQEAAPPQPILSAAQPPDWADDADTAELDSRYGRSGEAQRRRGLAGLAIGLLAGALAAQGAYLFRTELTQFAPALRPYLIAACAPLHCSVELPSEITEISVEASDLQADPDKPNRFVLHAALRNRAAYPQAFPHLELTLTDNRDRALARRVFTPTEWTPDSDIAAGFPGHRELSVSIPFDTTGIEASGYRIYIFYP